MAALNAGVCFLLEFSELFPYAPGAELCGLVSQSYPGELIKLFLTVLSWNFSKKIRNVLGVNLCGLAGQSYPREFIQLHLNVFR